MLTIFFALVSLLYATVGQAGGTAFLALMAFAAFPPGEMRPTALTLNIVAAACSTWLFNRGRLVDWPRLRPMLIASLPTALIGGFIVLDPHIYNVATGIVLLSAAVVTALPRVAAANEARAAPLAGTLAVGAIVGLVSGLTGVGGGVFLAPILIALQWASPRQTSAMSAPFILANSTVGLFGALHAGQAPSASTWLYAIAALAGAALGAAIGLRWLSQTATRTLLAAILGTAALQLFWLALR